MTPRPELSEAILNGYVSAMHNVNSAVMHLVAIEPHVGSLDEIARLEDIFARLRSKYQLKVQETQSNA